MKNNTKVINNLEENDKIDLKAAIHWILKSGIQKHDGSFYAWYDINNKKYSFIYPEITGYGIRLLIQLYETYRENIFLKNAIKAGYWLLKIIQNDGSIFIRYYDNNCNNFNMKYYDNSSYTFDAVICANALIDLYRITSNKKYMIGATQILNWYVGYQNSDGSINAGYNDNKRLINENHWSRTNGVHHLKDTMALMNYYEICKDIKYRDATIKLINWGIKLQNSNGRFKISLQKNDTYTHSHCYAIEGLLFSDNYFKEKKLIHRALLGANWLLEKNNTVEGLYNWYNSINNKIKVNDATAQCLRIWILLYKKGFNKFLTPIQNKLNYLTKMQCFIEDKKVYGSIYYGKIENKIIKHANSWVTMFVIQSLLYLNSNDDYTKLINKLF